MSLGLLGDEISGSVEVSSFCWVSCCFYRSAFRVFVLFHLPDLVPLVDLRGLAEAVDGKEESEERARKSERTRNVILINFIFRYNHFNLI